jgi:hypothetical protein
MSAVVALLFELPPLLHAPSVSASAATTTRRSANFDKGERGNRFSSMPKDTDREG